jgi:prepilin-type N-terminal cleavage/methylation domain-containing protein
MMGGFQRQRRGYNLLEVMFASVILLVTLTIVAQIQVHAIKASSKAEMIVVGTLLAQEKLAEVKLLIEAEGLVSDDVHETGDFDDYGDLADLEFEDSLDNYQWEYEVVEVDLAISGDLLSMMGEVDESLGGGGDSSQDMASTGLAALGVTDELITETLGKFIREVRVRVYWNDDVEESEKTGEIVEIVSHVISPKGAFQSMGGDEATAGAAGGGTGFQGTLGAGLGGGGQ